MKAMHRSVARDAASCADQRYLFAGAISLRIDGLERKAPDPVGVVHSLMGVGRAGPP